jgi:5-methylthioribose kinase
MVRYRIIKVVENCCQDYWIIQRRRFSFFWQTIKRTDYYPDGEKWQITMKFKTKKYAEEWLKNITHE